MTVDIDFFTHDYRLNELDLDSLVEDLDEELGEDNYIYEMTPAEFVEQAILMPDPHTRKMEKFDFSERRYLKDVYDCQADNILLMCGRQVEKSTTLANKALSYTCLIPHFKVLYVSPSSTQTKEFSKTRIKEMLETCPTLKTFYPSKLTDNIFEKKAKNRSAITLRYAFLNADRCRGLSADMIAYDEFQDLLLDNIPVIAEASSHSPFRWSLLSGTPKSQDNPIQYYWQTYSTMNEWAVPCERHGTNDPSTWHWNILDVANIGTKSLICDRCHKQIFAGHPLAQWVRTGNPDETLDMYEGFRIPQLMVPWISWKDILSKRKSYSEAKFYNEVLGRSFDSGQRPLTRRDVYDNCDPSLELNAEFIKKIKSKIGSRAVYAGIDWGQDSNQSYTVLTLGAYIDDRFTIFFAHQFRGNEAEPHEQMKKIIKIIKRFNVRRVGVDYGGGYWPNDELLRTFGKHRILRYQYSNPKEIMKYDTGKGRMMVHRSEVMAMVFNAIKRRNVFRFPRWKDFNRPFAADMLAIFSEYNERTRMTDYKKSPNMTDDAFHSLTYCFLASLVENPRPELIVPSANIDARLEQLELVY